MISIIAPDYLAQLNAEQRRAVEHGVAISGGEIGGPLLIIAGAGSGKTNTLGTSRRTSDRQRRRSAPDPADDLFAPGGKSKWPGASSASARRSWEQTQAS